MDSSLLKHLTIADYRQPIQRIYAGKNKKKCSTACDELLSVPTEVR